MSVYLRALFFPVFKSFEIVSKKDNKLLNGAKYAKKFNSSTCRSNLVSISKSVGKYWCGEKAKRLGAIGFRVQKEYKSMVVRMRRAKQ